MYLEPKKKKKQKRSGGNEPSIGHCTRRNRTEQKHTAGSRRRRKSQGCMLCVCMKIHCMNL